MSKGFPHRGDIYWVSLDPTLGAETKKTRPCLIVSNDIGNEYSDLVVVAPITSNINKVYRFEAKISIKGQAGKVMPQQVRAVDKTRLLQKIGKIAETEMLEVEEAIKRVFGLSY
ncbi:MAG: type II toxin-antitoxin system PemK/MazF family toxin [Parachlamydia sp.]|nr:type II toxin-antitoxin system PemK/MazF family toxin [Parachlamydia sp.]